jgi:hypothetical protein
MRTALLFATIATLTTTTFAEPHKRIQQAMARADKEIQETCGCSVTFSYSRNLDFTTAEGGDLQLNVSSAIRDIGTRLHHWCRKGEDFRAKACLMVKAVEVDEDNSTKRPYTVAVAKGVARTYIAGKNRKQLTNHGGAWVEKFLQSGKMPERKPDDEN